MHNDETSKRSLAAQHPQHVVQHGTRSGGDQANAARRVWDWALACDVKEALGLQLALERFKFARKEAHPTCSLHGCSDQLIAASWAIQINAAADNDDLSYCWCLFARANRSTEAHHIEGRLFISQREVLMAGRAAHGALHLASNDAIG
jgi:hypothetical protein